MKLIYAQNCDIYYDSPQERIIFAKRGTIFALKKPRAAMDILKEIICLCMNGCDIEAIFRDFPSEKRREYLQYTKLLWENHILVEMLPEHQCLDAGLLGLILGNFDGNPELIRFWLKTPIYCAGVPEVMDTWQGYGLSCAEYVPDIARQEPCLYVGKYSEAQCQQLLHGKNLMILFREHGGTSYLLFIDHYDRDIYGRFASFFWKENDSFYARSGILPLQMFLHFSNCFTGNNNQKLLCVAADATIHSFNIEKLEKESTTYFNREQIPYLDKQRALIQIEKLAETSPYLFQGCNIGNEQNCQSPICCYRINFGFDLGSGSYTGYHERYEEAASLAFLQGLEKMLNRESAGQWRCGTSREDYYARGYISLLEPSYSCFEIENPDPEIAQRLAYLEIVQRSKLHLYFSNSAVVGIGAVLICDETGYILWEGQNGYRLREDALNGVYRLIGQHQNSDVLQQPQLLLQEKYTLQQPQNILPEEYNAEQTVRRLQEYFAAKNKIVDERIWAYQAQIQETGMHVGEFYFVR